MTINDCDFYETKDTKRLTFDVCEFKLDTPIIWDNSGELLSDEYEPGLEGSIDGLKYFASNIVRVAIAKDENGDEVGRIAVLTSDSDDYDFQSYAISDSFFPDFERIDDESGFTLYVKLDTCMLTAQELVNTFFAIY